MTSGNLCPSIVLQSSLLLAILGELARLDGDINILGHVAYASQQPWVFSATLRENVLFGQEYEEERYDRVIRACALKCVRNLHDIE